MLLKTNLHAIVIVVAYLTYMPLYFSLAMKKIKNNGFLQFSEKFKTSFLSNTTILRICYKIFAFLELGVVILYLISLFRLEFLSNGNLLFFNAAIVLQLIIMAMYACGHAIIQDFKGIVTVWSWMTVILLFMVFISI